MLPSYETITIEHIISKHGLSSYNLFKTKILFSFAKELFKCFYKKMLTEFLSGISPRCHILLWRQSSTFRTKTSSTRCWWNSSSKPMKTIHHRQRNSKIDILATNLNWIVYFSIFSQFRNWTLCTLLEQLDVRCQTQESHVALWNLFHRMFLCIFIWILLNSGTRQYDRM